MNNNRDLEKIFEVIYNYSGGIDFSEKTRLIHIHDYKKIYCKLCYDITQSGYQKIADNCGLYSHASVMSNKKSCERLIDSDNSFSKKYYEIADILNSMKLDNVQKKYSKGVMLQSKYLYHLKRCRTLKKELSTIKRISKRKLPLTKLELNNIEVNL